jgi:two-component system response regulator FixJ
MARRLAERGVEAWPLLSAGELLDLLSRLRPSVVVLSLSGPAQGGLDLLAELKRRGIDWPIIAYSADADVATAVAAMRLGAIDFLEAPLDPQLLTAALATARSRLEEFAENRHLIEEARERLARLTRRERDVAASLLAGNSNKTVAHALGISVRTAEMHRAHLIAKLEVRTIAEAAVVLSRAGLAAATKAPDYRSVFTRNLPPASFMRAAAGSMR